MRKRDKIAVIFMIALWIGVFFGARNVMAPDRSQPVAVTSPGVEYGAYYDYKTASQDSPDESESPALD
jgi:hypothetical protein